MSAQVQTLEPTQVQTSEPTQSQDSTNERKFHRIYFSVAFPTF